MAHLTVDSSHRQLTRSAAVIGSATFASRILGFVRDVLIARFFGTGAAAQAFVIAFMIPTLLRDLVAEGASSAAIVPTLVTYWRKGKEAFWEVVNFLLNDILLLLALLTFLGILLAPVLVALAAPGFLKMHDQYELTVFLTRVLFPFIFFIGLAAYAMGVLNTMQHFLVPALGSAILNIVMILSIFFLVPSMDPPILGLAVGVLVGGAVQLLVQWPALRRRGFVYRPAISLEHPGVRQAGRLIAPRIFGSIVYQLGVIVDRAFASLAFIIGEGGVAALYYSNRVIQLPFALFGVSFATAVLPTLSDQAHEEGLESFRKTLLFSLKSIFFVMVPAVVGMLVLARPIVQVLFERGSFDAYSTEITTQALFYYGLGLLAFSGSRILTSGFFSLQDTRTPVKAAVASLLLNVILNAALIVPMKIKGIALATSIASTYHFFYLYVLLRRRIGDFGGHTLVHSFYRFSAAGVLMGGILFFCDRTFLVPGASFWTFRFFCVMMLGGVSYYLFSLLFRIEEAHRLTRWIFRRK
ncbi:MAG: murein biosynthesis integral membrane protein MurJ [Candidatus Omnitrophota bacterium]